MKKALYSVINVSYTEWDSEGIGTKDIIYSDGIYDNNGSYFSIVTIKDGVTYYLEDYLIFHDDAAIEKENKE